MMRLVAGLQKVLYSTEHRHVFFLILGTAIGAGMMTLPLLTQGLSLSALTCILGVSGLVMYNSAQIWIELAISSPDGSNLASFVRRWMPIVEYPTHFAYLAFFWSLMACYLSTMPTFLEPFFRQEFLWLNQPAVYSVALMGFLYLPRKLQGIMNQVFVIAMVTVLTLIFTLTTYEIQHDWLMPVATRSLDLPLMAPLMMFFGYHLTIPSFLSFVKKQNELEEICLVGSFAMFILYWIWCALLLSALSSMMSSQEIISDQGFLEKFATFTQSTIFLQPIAWFSLLAMWTSCLGMSLGTCDYIRDLFSFDEHRYGRVVALTVLPSLIFLYMSAQGYRALLNFAAYIAIYLLIALPAALVLRRDYLSRHISMYTYRAVFLFAIALILLYFTPM